jgi:hypothetical protein
MDPRPPRRRRRCRCSSGEQLGWSRRGTGRELEGARERGVAWGAGGGGEGEISMGLRVGP